MHLELYYSVLFIKYLCTAYKSSKVRLKDLHAVTLKKTAKYICFITNYVVLALTRKEQRKMNETK